MFTRNPLRSQHRLIGHRERCPNRHPEEYLEVSRVGLRERLLPDVRNQQQAGAGQAEGEEDDHPATLERNAQRIPVAVVKCIKALAKPIRKAGYSALFLWCGIVIDFYHPTREHRDDG